MPVSLQTGHIPDASADEKWWKEIPLIVVVGVAMTVLMLLGFDSLLP